MNKDRHNPPLVCFAHGKESGPWGSKIQAMAEVATGLGFAVESLDYQGIDDPDDRVDKLTAWAEKQEGPLLLVGSSMGAYVSVVAAERLEPAGLFLLAPALAIPGFGRVPNPRIRVRPAAIVHGWQDEIIPVPLIIDYARQQNLTLHLLPGDHRLISVLPAVLDLFTDFLKQSQMRLHCRRS